MNVDVFLEEVTSIGFGKRLPDALYIYAPTADQLPDRLRTLVQLLRHRLELTQAFNVLKLSHDMSLSFLEYNDFFESPHPALVRSVRVQLATGKVKRFSYDSTGNPPILHRKECLLPSDHERIGEFSRLTQQEEAAGLFDQPATIGFKENWEQLLRTKGLVYQGHQLISTEVVQGTLEQTANTVQIHRHRTAITRGELSRPIRQAMEFGILRDGKTVFDYGCGLGTDMEGLQALGYEVSGWDPAYFPSAPKQVADVVNLGYVVNVIESPPERVAVLVDAWRYTREALIVSTMVRGQESYDYVRDHADGVLTSRNTFQKYFEPSEIQGIIESALDTEAHAVSLGIYVAFRDARAAQSFLSARSRRHIDWEQISNRLGFLRPKRKVGVVDLYTQHKELLDSFWQCVLDLGRLPKSGEFSRDEELKGKLGGPKKVHRLFIEHYGPDAYEVARRQRREDLLVYLALANFRKRIPQKHLDDRLQQDLLSHFGSYRQAQAEGLELLMSLGSPAVLEAAIQGLPFGWFDKEEGHLSIHRSLLDLLPPSLRVFVGCAGQLYGNPKEADVVKIHLRSRKLTLLFYDDFDQKPFPELNTRIKIDLPRLLVNVFEYHDSSARQLLFFKERFIGPDNPMRLRMERISRRLSAIGITLNLLGSNDKNAPSKKQFEMLIERYGLRSDLTKRPEKNLS